MTKDIHAQGSADGLVTAPMGIGDPSSEKRHAVLPELVEGSDTVSCGLAPSQGTGLVGAGTGDAARGHRLHNKVGDCKIVAC